MEAAKKRPSKKQRELLDFIDGFIKTHGYGPSYREIMRALNYKSVSTVAIHIDNLIAGGNLRKRDRSARSLEVLSRQSAALPAAGDGVITEAKSKWLVDLINRRLAAAEQQPDQKSIDNLYVLVGSLHILGLEEAHIATKSRLLELEKRHKLAKA